MPGNPPVVVIVDDESEMRKALRRLLASRGFSVVEFSGGGELLAALGVQAMDCLLLDLHMPDVNGFDVLTSLQSRQLCLPVIVITGHDEPGTEDRARSLGAVAYLKKPVDRDALLDAIGAALF